MGVYEFVQNPEPYIDPATGLSAGNWYTHPDYPDHIVLACAAIDMSMYGIVCYRMACDSDTVWLQGVACIDLTVVDASKMFLTETFAESEVL